MNDELLNALPGPDEATMDRLHARLVAAAADGDALDITYRTVDSPIGSLLLASTPVGLVRVAFEVEDHDRVLSVLSDSVSPRILHAPGRLDEAAHEIDEYFAGRRRGFDLPLDMQLAHGFRRAVLEHLREIAYGSRESYATVATASGSPRAVRAVGSACARNPLPLVIPCHRVVRSDGSIGQYAGGADAKQTLLALEAS